LEQTNLQHNSVYSQLNAVNQQLQVVANVARTIQEAYVNEHKTCQEKKSENQQLRNVNLLLANAAKIEINNLQRELTVIKE
jgi:hypothetical protein